MNIIINKELHEYLQTIIIESIVFGSVAREDVRNENSDTDYMHIIKMHKSLATSSVYCMHSLQYREVDDTGKTIADHVYSSIPQFIQGIINSESMIPWECLFDGKFQHNSDIENLKKYKDLITTFKAARGFLGLARRDSKDASKYYNKDKHKCSKKLEFVERSIKYCEYIINSVIANEQMVSEELNWKDWQTDYNKFASNLELLNSKIDYLRDSINNMLNDKKMSYSCSISTLSKIHTLFLKNIVLLEDNGYSNQIMNLYYIAALENKFN